MVMSVAVMMIVMVMVIVIDLVMEMDVVCSGGDFTSELIDQSQTNIKVVEQMNQMNSSTWEMN